jgi:pyruvate dehydrogenase E2 component (dihydrolipoamide acetyltransferase)
MGYLIKMPQMGMSMDEGTVVEWVAEEGQEIEAEEVIVIVESEKASNEVEAREDGTVRRILVDEGEVVEPGEPIGIFAAPDEDISDLEDQIDSGTVSGRTDTGGSTSTSANASKETEMTDAEDVQATPGARKRAEEEDVDLTTVDGTGPGGAITEDDVSAAAATSDSSTEITDDSQATDAEDVQATPGARKRAEEEDVDLTTVDGTGPGGAITEDDVSAAITAESTTTADEAITKKATKEPEVATRTIVESAPLSGVQQTISDRLGESYRNAAHVTINREFETDTVDEALSSAETLGIEVSLNDVLLKAVAGTLSQKPEFNALYEDGEHKLIEEINIGVAIDNEDGLLTPVVANADEKSLAKVNEVRRTLTDRVLKNEYTVDDLEGGTFTISNLGMFGVDHFDPIINPPEIAILGVGRIRDDGRMTLSLSFDHRVVNGADAARFLDTLVEKLISEETIATYFSNRA